MFTRRRIMVIAGVALLLALAYYFYPGRPEPVPVGLEASRVTDAWIEIVHQRAENGYWLVLRGTHIGDQAVAAATAASLSHAAIFDKERDEVIESVGKGVVRTPLRELLAQAHRLLIIRPRDYSPESGREAVERARAVVGHGYDWLGIAGAQQDRRFYCTELCAYAYRARELGWMPDGVLHPDKMAALGEVIFDSGPRTEDAANAAVSEELRTRFAQRIDGARGVAYAAKVADGVYRGGVPDSEGVEWLRSLGIRTVINLRHFHGDSEGEMLRAAGLRYERIPLESTDAPEPEQVARFFEILADEKARPVYIHCLHGVDRTGTMLALYRMEIESWNNSDALAEMEWFGAHGLLHDLRRFVGSYTPTGRWRR
jgi:protein tyrosine phosphatase (PTP) superfamily phosphohydrolase (DUF442 family)